MPPLFGGHPVHDDVLDADDLGNIPVPQANRLDRQLPGGKLDHEGRVNRQYPRASPVNEAELAHRSECPAAVIIPPAH